MHICSSVFKKRKKMERKGKKKNAVIIFFNFVMEVMVNVNSLIKHVLVGVYVHVWVWSVCLNLPTISPSSRVLLYFILFIDVFQITHSDWITCIRLVFSATLLMQFRVLLLPDIFYSHIYFSLSCRPGQTLLLLSEGGCGLFPLVSTGNVGVKCHRGIARRVSRCDCHCEISIFPSTASVSVSSFMYAFSGICTCLNLQFSHFSFRSYCQREVYCLSNINSK